MMSSIMPAELNLEHYGNDTFRRTIEATQDGVSFDFTGYTADMQVKSRKESSTVLLTVTVTLSAGLIELEASSSSLQSLPVGKYYYDLRMTNSSETKRWLVGKFIKIQDVTR
jgi:hypothetical protein